MTARINQNNANDYTSSAKIDADIRQIITYLQTMELGGKTPAELLAELFDTTGNIKTTVVAFRWDSGNLQYRAGSSGAWANVDGATLAALQGAPGASGAGTGDMVQATYDPDHDGKIANAQLALADNGIAQVKIAGLVADLKARMTVEVGATAPTSPTYPPSGPVSGWLDTSDAANPVLKIWDGATTWQAIGGSASTSTSTSTAGIIRPVAGESLANRDHVFVATGDRFGADQASGGTPSASGGTATNAFDGNAGTQWDSGSLTGWLKYVKAAQYRVGQVEMVFPAGANNLALAFETSDDGTTFNPVHSVTAQNYTGNVPTIFEIPGLTSAKEFRVRQTGGTTQMSIVSMVLRDRVFQKGRAYKVNDTDTAPHRKSDITGITLGTGTTGSRLDVRTATGVVDNMTGLATGTILYSDTTAGKLSITPNARSTLVGEAQAADKLNFHPVNAIYSVGETLVFSGAIADLPYDIAPLDGRYLSRTQYPVLFAKFGTKYGAGDGQTTFQVPDLRDRFLVGARSDNSGVANTNLTGALTASGGSRTSNVTSGGTGSNLSGVTGAMQVTVDPPYYAQIFATKVG